MSRVVSRKTPFHSAAACRGLLVSAWLLAGCAPEVPEPVAVDSSGTSDEAAALIRELTSAAAAEPRNAERRGELGLALEANGMPKAAVATYLQAERLAANDPRWSYLAAVTSAKLGDLDAALAALDRSLSNDASYVPAHLYRGAWLLDLDRIDEAEAAYARALRLDPDNRFARFGRARVHLRRQEGEKALALLEDMATGREADPYLRQLLGLAYRQTGDLDRARAALADGRGERSPEWPDPRRRPLGEYARGFAAEKERADAFIQAGRWQAAAATLERLREREPTDPDLLTNLALAYRNLERIDDAVGLLEFGLQHHPDHVHLHVNLGAAYERRGQFERALREFDRAIELNPNLGFVYQRKGMILLFRLRRVEAAIDAFERAVAHESRDRFAHVYLGIALLEAKRWNEAAERLELALRQDPSNLDAMIALAVARMELGDFDGAEALLTRVERLSPGAPKVARLRERFNAKRESMR